MYEGAAAPLSVPWANGRAAEPAARYGGHDPAGADPALANPAATWWKKVKTVPVSLRGSWSAEVRVREEGPYTFAAVNSITREYVLVEVEVGDEPARSDGTAGGSAAVAAPPTGPDEASAGTLRRVGVPAASSALAIGLALGLGLLRRTRIRRRTC